MAAPTSTDEAIHDQLDRIDDLLDRLLELSDDLLEPVNGWQEIERICDEGEE